MKILTTVFSCEIFWPNFINLVFGTAAKKHNNFLELSGQKRVFFTVLN